jgi:hypothetical protein
MPRRAPTLEDLAGRFHVCLKDTGGLPYGELLRRYRIQTGLKDRMSKNHLKAVSDGIGTGEVDELAIYSRGGARVFGRIDDKVFMDAKEASEKEPETDRYPSYAGMGGLFQDSPVRSEWTHCPVKGKITRATIITMGVADFMECPLCSWAHFLGVNPRMKDRRLVAWQVDPLVNATEYADAIGHGLMGNPRTFRAQPSRIRRVLKGGHYVGLWFRTSWDHDPAEDMKKWGPVVPVPPGEFETEPLPDIAPAGAGPSNSRGRRKGSGVKPSPKGRRST